MKAALFCGGWEGHRPEAFRAWADRLLSADGFEVVTYDTLEPLAEPEDLADVDLIIPYQYCAYLQDHLRVCHLQFRH